MMLSDKKGGIKSLLALVGIYIYECAVAVDEYNPVNYKPQTGQNEE